MVNLEIEIGKHRESHPEIEIENLHLDRRNGTLHWDPYLGVKTRKSIIQYTL